MARARSGPTEATGRDCIGNPLFAMHLPGRGTDSRSDRQQMSPANLIRKAPKLGTKGTPVSVVCKVPTPVSQGARGRGPALSVNYLRLRPFRAFEGLVPR